jgi:hypothetical protein
MKRDNTRDGKIINLIRLDKNESCEKIFERFFKNIIFLNNDHKKSLGKYMKGQEILLVY